MATPPPPQAPRRAPRYDIRISAELRAGDRTMLGTTRNLSTGGVMVEVERELAEGCSLAIRLFVVEDDIETAGGAGLEVQGTVQWCAEAERCYHVGIQFVGLTDQQTRALSRALAAVTPS
jgi:hypothetical protein